jgi:hypothetical protein
MIECVVRRYWNEMENLGLEKEDNDQIKIILPRFKCEIFKNKAMEYAACIDNRGNFGCQDSR